MAKAGDKLVNLVTGLRTVFRKTARDTDGELLQVDWIGDPGWTTGPDHVQPRQEERFEVLSGRLGLRVDGVERIYGVGEVIVAAPGSAHAAWNAGSDDEVHVLVNFRPALRTATAFEPLAGLARDGKTNRAGAPRNPLLALVLHHFEEEIYFVRPPLAVQRVIFGLLARVARLLGYRAEYPYPYARHSEASRAGI
jgi:quercetin dioxygenase-like cupin family protein